MSFTYTPADLASVVAATKNRAVVRLKIGDVDNGGHVLEDEEIDYLLEENGSTDLVWVALKAAEVGLAKLAKSQDAEGPGGIRITRSQRFSQMKDMIAKLEQACVGRTEITMTGTLADQDAQDDSATRPAPIFSVGMDSFK